MSTTETKKRGLFIVFEGIDGCGKSTQAGDLREALESEGRRVYSTREPSEGTFGVMLRQVLSGEIVTDPRVLAPLFAADRLDHILKEDGLLAKVNEGVCVICDRYYFSNYAYQSVDLTMEAVIEMNRPAAELLRPDLTIYLDVDPDTAMERITKNREKTELFEKRDRLAACREKYMDAFRRLAEEEKVLIIDGTKSREEIAAEIIAAVRGLQKDTEESR